MPKVDKENNETGGIRNTTLLAPLHTHTGLNLQLKSYSEGDLNALNGMFIPFPITKKERLKPGDQRPSLEERYKLYEGYVAAGELRRHVFLLPADTVLIIFKQPTKAKY